MPKAHINYWDDHCPICQEKAISGCRCPDNDRRCSNGHTWRRADNLDAIILEKAHGAEIKRIPYTTEDKTRVALWKVYVLDRSGIGNTLGYVIASADSLEWHDIRSGIGCDIVRIFASVDDALYYINS